MKYRYHINGEERKLEDITMEERIQLTETFIINLGYEKCRKADVPKELLDEDDD